MTIEEQTLLTKLTKKYKKLEPKLKKVVNQSSPKKDKSKAKVQKPKGKGKVTEKETTSKEVINYCCQNLLAGYSDYARRRDNRRWLTQLTAAEKEPDRLAFNQSRQNEEKEKTVAEVNRNRRRCSPERLCSPESRAGGATSSGGWWLRLQGARIETKTQVLLSSLRTNARERDLVVVVTGR
ncbi:hypothetical protein JCGZ_13093 [Jatropha curcas]|uniref:Uncharacterized protein n=1 Tax=Jatropha curcas TaxID=180498 RepID=A0A067KE55_JATCU|nr:hypothetical protein JCGZ_13093 [Jatropha curcas]